MSSCPTFVLLSNILARKLGWRSGVVTLRHFVSCFEVIRRKKTVHSSLVFCLIDEAPPTPTQNFVLNRLTVPLMGLVGDSLVPLISFRQPFVELCSRFPT